jgi:hypothetical protein
MVQKGRVRVGKVHGATNVADVLTKYHTADNMYRILAQHGIKRAAATDNTVGPRGGVERKAPPDPEGSSSVCSIFAGVCS